MLTFTLLLGLASITPLDGAGYRQLLDDHRGDVVLVNIWATWCIPCREEFPDLVRLDRERREQGLKVISISIDSLDAITQAQEFFQQHQAEFAGFIQVEKDFAAFQQAVDPTWPGAIPATFLFDRAGKVVFKRIGLVTYEELVEQMDRLEGP